MVAWIQQLGKDGLHLARNRRSTCKPVLLGAAVKSVFRVFVLPATAPLNPKGLLKKVSYTFVLHHTCSHPFFRCASCKRAIQASPSERHDNG